MLDRIDAIHDAAVAEIESAGTAAALEELRVKHLGRKAELPNLLRGVAQLPPEERGAVGKRANEVRRALESLIEERAAALEAGELDARLAADTVDMTLPGSPPEPVGRLHLITSTRREIEDVFIGLGFDVVEGPEVDTVFYNFDALNHDPAHPARSRSDTFYVDDDTRAAHAHLADADPRDAAVAAAAGDHRPRPRLPARLRRDALAAVHADRGAVRRRGHHARRPQGGAAGVRAGDFRHGPRDPAAPALLPVHRAVGRGRRVVFQCAASDGSPCRLCKGSGWIEILGSGMVDPNVFGYVREHGYDPEKVQGFAFGMGVERIAMLKHGVPDLRLFFDNDLRLLEQFG